MSENVNNNTRWLVIFAAISIVGLIVVGARWSGIRLPSFRSELDRPIDEISPYPPENIPPWRLGGTQLHPPAGNLRELDACISKAQYNLPRFIRAITSPTSTQSDFCICVKSPRKNGDGSILFWYYVGRTPSGRFTGHINFTYDGERYASEVENNHTCDVSKEEIVDWLYFDGGKMVGGYTAGYFHRNR